MYRLFIVLLIAFSSFFVSALIALLLSKPLFGVDFGAMAGNANYDDPSVMNALRFTQFLNASALFLVPAVVYSWLMSKPLAVNLSLTQKPEWRVIILCLLLLIFALPFENFIGQLNQQISFPESLAAFESKLRAMETAAEKATLAFLNMTSLGDYLLALGIMAILPAIGEEFLFRGVLQKLFHARFSNPHIAIWITAIIFSAIHMQFFGFFPRMIMGAALGYLFYWSGSLWLSIAAHFFNNAFAVTVAYFVGLDKLPEGIDQAGSQSIGVSLISLSLTALVLFRVKSAYNKV